MSTRIAARIAALLGALALGAAALETVSVGGVRRAPGSPGAPVQAAVPSGAQTPAQAPAEPGAGLRVLLSVASNTVTQPFPARISLHYHNPGSSPLWLYRHVRDPKVVAEGRRQTALAADQAAARTSGGSSLVGHLEWAGGGAAPDWAEPPGVTVFSSAGLPHPHLERLGPGEDADEGAVLELRAGKLKHGDNLDPAWGRYRLSVTYVAQFSDGDSLSRNLGTTVWQGDAPSNAVEVDLEPAPGTAHGSVAGRVSNTSGSSLRNVMVTLSDGQNHNVGQILTGDDGRFSFTPLPWGTYWITARRPLDTADTGIFEHVDVSAGDPIANLTVVLLDRDINEGKLLLHKPFLLKITSSGGKVLGDVDVVALYTSGTIVETVKGRSDNDGFAALDLIPGRVYLTLKHRKCEKLDRRIDVSDGDGIDGTAMEMDCTN